jgi:hypothetical protein
MLIEFNLISQSINIEQKKKLLSLVLVLSQQIQQLVCLINMENQILILLEFV